MNRPKVTAQDYMDFLIATPRQATATEAARCQPPRQRPPAHDAFTRLLRRLEPDAQRLWQDVQPHVRPGEGWLILDDTVLDKPYARHMELVHHVWSGKHKRVVQGINLITLLWTDGDCHLPLDYRLYDKRDGQTKNEHFRDMLRVAKERGFQPRMVLFDSFYTSLENLKLLRGYGWHWLTRLRDNRRVNPDGQGLRRLDGVAIGPAGRIVHLEGYGRIRVFLIVAPDGDKEYWATSQLEMSELERLQGAETSWKIEEYHRGLKQMTNIERCQARVGRAQRNHLDLALRAFVQLERWCFQTGISWFEAKTDLCRDAVRAYLAAPRYRPKPATA